VEKQIGIGLIGTGFAKNVQLPAFRACDGAFVASIASARFERAQETADELGIGHFTDDWRQTVDHPEVDLVCITTPPDLHREMTLYAAAKGKHILCEKPMAMDVAEAEEMSAAVEGSPTLALIDHELRFLPGRQRAFEMLREGLIGTIRHAKTTFKAPHRGNPELPWNWWSDVNAGGGALGAIGSHVIDSLHWLLGTSIKTISCQLQAHIKERRDASGQLRAVTSDDESLMIMRFEDSELTSNATGIVSVSMTELPEYQHQIELYGSKGAMSIDFQGSVAVALSGESKWTPLEVPPATALPGIPNTGFASAFLYFAPRIVEAIRSGQKEIEHAATFADGLKVQRVLDAARASDASGRVVQIIG
jgi:predicted dehydrogenase